MARRERQGRAKSGPLQQPPVSTQFQPGQSGNPGGRPKKDRDFAKLINTELDTTVTLMRDGKRVKLTKRELVATSLVNDAAKGNLKAIDAVVRYAGLGMATQDQLTEVDPQVLATFLARYCALDEGGQK